MCICDHSQQLQIHHAKQNDGVFDLLTARKCSRFVHFQSCSVALPPPRDLNFASSVASTKALSPKAALFSTSHAWNPHCESLQWQNARYSFHASHLGLLPQCIHAGQKQFSQDSPVYHACNNLPVQDDDTYWSFPFGTDTFGVCPAFRACDDSFDAIIGTAQCTRLTSPVNCRSFTPE